jgi:hypothetical protein
MTGDLTTLNTRLTEETIDMPKTIIAKYPGKCFECGEPIKPGQPIKHYGRLHNEHAECADEREDDRSDGRDDDDREPGTTWPPSRCELDDDRRQAKAGITVARFSSGAVITQNSRGRCEDAPCCGCCT